MSKIIKKALKLLLTVAVVVYGYCIIKGIDPIDCRVSEEGGIVSVAGNEINLPGEEFREAAEAYGEVERRADELIPDAIRNFFNKIRDFFGGGSDSEASDDA